MFITPQLTFQKSYKTRELEFLQKNQEYNNLKDKQKQFVKSVIDKICSPKPNRRYKTVSSYLLDIRSECFKINNIDHQQNITIQNVDMKKYVEQRINGQIYGFGQYYQLMFKSKSSIHKLIFEEIQKQHMILL